jgi:hypothetical protein
VTSAVQNGEVPERNADISIKPREYGLNFAGGTSPPLTKEQLEQQQLALTKSIVYTDGIAEEASADSVAHAAHRRTTAATNSA